MLPPPAIPDRYEHQLKIGTCSWKYESWQGLVYDPDMRYKPHDYLPDYAKYFNTVEVDQWFWSLFPGGVKLPDAQLAQRYANSVPDGFVFTVKAPNSITLTHHYAKGPPSHANKLNPNFLDVGLLNAFFEALEPMRSKLGPVMFQFEYLNKKKMPSKEAFLDRLDAFFAKAPEGFQYAIETRNPNYFSEDFFEFLRNRSLGFVLLDGYYMPPTSKVTDNFNVRTAEFSIIRLHGPDRAKIEEKTGGDWSQIVDPHDRRLDAAADLVRTNVAAGTTTYVNVNNHYEGSAPLTIERLLQRLQS